MRKTRPLEERFWEKVKKAGPDECWLWQASTDKDGYGQIGGISKTSGKKTMLKAHRVSWEIENGSIDGDILQALHKCDVRNCVNPKHLFLGTTQDNTADMKAKGRARWGECPAKGSNHGRSKLTEEDVREIRLHYALGKVTYKELGVLHGVTTAVVGKVVNRDLWKHVA